MAINEPTTTRPAAAEVGYVDWSAILGGVALAGAITLVLGQFGAATGLASAEPFRGEDVASWQVLVAGLWAILAAVASASAGAYVAGRMRARVYDAKPEEVEFRDGVHGLIVWAAATVVLALILGVLAAMSVDIDSLDMTAPELSDVGMRIAGNVSTIFAFATAAGAALAAGAAYFAAKTGGEHRDDGISVDVMTPKLLRRR